MPDIMANKSKPAPGGTTKNDSSVIEMPKHVQGEYNPYERGHNKSQLGPMVKGNKK